MAVGTPYSGELAPRSSVSSWPARARARSSVSVTNAPTVVDGSSSMRWARSR